MPAAPGNNYNPHGRPRDLGRELERLEERAATIRQMLSEKRSLARALQGGLAKSDAAIIADQAHVIADLSRQLRAMFLGQMPTARDLGVEPSSAERDAALLALGAFLDRACGGPGELPA